MYPTLTLAGQHIEMTGLGIIIGIIIFCIVCYSYSKHMNLNFWDLFHFVPTLLIVTYFMGSYGGFILKTGHLVPYSIIEMGQIIIPPDFGFHAASLAVGLLFGSLLFLYKLPHKLVRKKRIDCIAIAYMLALIIVGVFFVLGDHMIGLPTSSSLGVSALTPLSELSKFTKVYPVGFFLSLSALLSYLLSLLVFKKQVASGRGVATFSVFFFLLAIVLLFQNYPRHLVISMGEIRIDLNQYILLVLSILCALSYGYIYKSFRSSSQKKITNTIPPH